MNMSVCAHVCVHVIAHVIGLCLYVGILWELCAHICIALCMLVLHGHTCVLWCMVCACVVCVFRYVCWVFLVNRDLLMLLLLATLDLQTANNLFRTQSVLRWRSSCTESAGFVGSLPLWISRSMAKITFGT